ncbi:unnamed protein product [Schistocephalus solidus]|uniref:Fucosyltransferase n=1 Tax=Schistocephalus solidus TaxID=70667 RepID=A0A183T5A7_SCHSO|nr:unnamed protein product [Schistocephalus solidus]
MLPLIFYDKRLAYHPTFMEGCEFRCRFTSNLTQLNRSQLVVFTSNPSPDERLYAGDIPWAFESAEPLHRMPWLSEEVKKRVDKYGRKAKYCPLAGLCFEHLSRNYKFYLSFENANCEGYITEKFFVNALGYGMVPIVYGASREELYARAPPNSYIHVDEFKTVADLAKYLNYLDKNDTAYASYFAWKEHGEVLTLLLLLLLLPSGHSPGTFAYLNGLICLFSAPYGPG